METFSKNDYKLFRSLASVSQKSLKNTLFNYLNKKYNKIINTEKYIYAIGEIPIALVAHMDTVFAAPPKDIYYDRDRGVIWSPQGLGADDRAGVFSILKIIQSGLRPSVIFCCDEEIGGIGAEQLVKDYPNPLSELNYIIELDRRGANDCVFYDCDNEEFEAFIEPFGFITSWGSFSDISEICPIWKVAGVNLSVGYENEHSKEEILHVQYLLSTIRKVKGMLQAASESKFFEYIPSTSYYAGQYYRIAQGTDEGFTKCDKCGKYFSEFDVVPVLNRMTKRYEYYCIDCCADDNLNWCSACGYPFLSSNGEELCPECKKKGAQIPWKSITVKSSSNSMK